MKLYQKEKDLLCRLYMLCEINSPVNNHWLSQNPVKLEWVKVEIKLIEGYFQSKGVMDKEGCFNLGEYGEAACEYWNEIEENYELWKEWDEKIWAEVRSI